MKKNIKGQALVEFIIILPVFIFMILTIVDIGKMLYDKTAMQHNLSSMVVLYKNGASYEDMSQELKKVDENQNLELSNENNEYAKIVIKKKPNITTPGLNLIIKDDLKVSMVVYYAQ